MEQNDLGKIDLQVDLTFHSAPDLFLIGDISSSTNIRLVNPEPWVYDIKKWIISLLGDGHCLAFEHRLAAAFYQPIHNNHRNSHCLDRAA